MKKKYDDNWKNYDQVFAMLAVLNEINKYGERLRAIIEKAQDGKVAIREVAFFMNLNSTTPLLEAGQSINLYDVNVEFTELINAYEVPDKGLHIHFAIILPDPDAEIFEIKSFDYWNIYKDQPQLLTCVGEKYVNYNKKFDCKMAVIDNSSNFIFEKCHKQGYTDPKLNKWRQATTGNIQSLQ